MARISEELGAGIAQADDLGDELLVVARVVVVAAAGESAPHLLAQVAAAGIGEEGLHARARVEDLPLCVVAARAGGRGGGDERMGVLVGQHVLAEIGVERGEALVDLRQSLLRDLVQARAAPRELGVAKPGEPLLLRRQARLLARLVDGGDAREEPCVLDDPVVEAGEPGLHLALDVLESGRAHRRGEDAVDRRRPVERPAAALHRLERVRERGRRGVIGDAVDLGQPFGHRDLERRLEVLDLHLVERRNAAERATPRGNQGVCFHDGLLRRARVDPFGTTAPTGNRLRRAPRV